MKRSVNRQKVDEALLQAVSAIEINNLENYISESLEQVNFEKLVLPAEKRDNVSFVKNAEFISVMENDLEVLSEEEFFDLVGVCNKRLSSRSGRYQRSLYSHYMRAKREKDEGYRMDILLKAKILKENIQAARLLMNNELFMREWSRTVGTITPVRDLQENGRMRRINIVRSYVE